MKRERSKYGDPCARCGECCRTVTCAVGTLVFKDVTYDVCPALYENDGIHYCRLAVLDGRMGGTLGVKYYLATDRGCTNGAGMVFTEEMKKEKDRINAECPITNIDLLVVVTKVRMHMKQKG